MKRIVTLMIPWLLSAGAANAFQFEVTDDIKGSLDSQATVGAGIRLNNPNPSMTTGNPAQWANGDNGDLNYKAGQPFSTYTKLTPELLMQFPEQIKLMARGTLLYDFMATDTNRTSLPQAAAGQVARNYELLDLWASKEFTLNGQTARVRVGNQVISWGESIFTMGGINQTNAMDIQKLMIPGTQLKEAVLPAPMISFATGLGNGVNVEAYYQWAWNRNLVPPAGTYWSIANIYDAGRTPLFLNAANTNFGGNPAGVANGTTLAIPYAPDKVPQGQGEFGIAVHYKPQGLPLDLGFYFMNYHDKMPVLLYGTGDVAGSTQWRFLDNRQLYGVSANFPVGDWAVGWELSYRPKEAVSLSSSGTRLSDGTIDTNPYGQAGSQGWTNTDKYQMHLTGLLNLSPGDQGWLLNLLGADGAVFTGEAVGIYFPYLHNVYASGSRQNMITGQMVPTYQVPAAGYMSWMANTSDPNSSASQTVPGVGTKWSGGATVDFNWTYDGSIIPGWQVTPGCTFFWAVVGDTPTMLNTFAEGAKSTNAYILFNMNPAKWQAGINYAKFFGGAGGGMGGISNLRQPLADRDFIGGFITRNF